MFTPKHFSSRYYKKMYTVYQTSMGATGILPYITKETLNLKSSVLEQKINVLIFKGNGAIAKLDKITP